MSDYMRNRRGEEGAGTEGFFCRFTFGQFFAILVLEVFTLFFVFYLGARYGREFLGLDKGPTVAAVETAAPAAEEATEGGPQVLTTSDPEAAKVAQELMQKADTPELKDRIAKMFDQTGTAAVAGKTPEVIDRNRAAELVAPPPAETGRTPGEVMAENAATAEAEGRPAALPPEQPSATGGQRSLDPELAKAEDATTKSEARDTSVIRVKSADNGRYAMQVGSYPKLDEATRSVERWKGKGYPAYMMIADIPDRGRWYRVRIGGFASREDCSRYLKEFQTRENVEALIVMNEQ